MRAILIFISLFALSSSKVMADDQDSNLHFQSTIVSQEHGGFSSPYSGTKSLDGNADRETSITWTAFSGLRLARSLALYTDAELSGGTGFSHTQGVAGFPNGEIYRVDDPTPKWSLARFYLRQTIGLGGEQERLADTRNQLEESVDVKRITVIAGKFSLNDFFDNNTFSHDPRTQFLNWALMDHGAWDYAADTKGYTWGLFLEFNQPAWSVRWASVLVPIQANQMTLDKNFPAARGDNLEFEYRYKYNENPGAIRLLFFENHANMGRYRSTLDNAAYGNDVTKTRSRSIKYGIGLGIEQALSPAVGSFLRASWNDGHTETWNFTEIDHSLTAGLSLKGSLWKRPSDTAGLALIANGLSKDHQEYLAAGGQGFMLGEGRLSYNLEKIAEVYYSLQLMPGLTFTGDYQFIQNPGYNSDRGPVSVTSMRVHYEI